MGKIYPDRKESKYFEHIFRAYDVDNNSSISFHEFMGFYMCLNTTNVNDLLKMVFRIIDIDNDGSVSKEELVQIMQALDGMSSTDEADSGDRGLIRTDSKITNFFTEID